MLLRVILFTLAALGVLVGAAATFAPTSAARLALTPALATTILPNRTGRPAVPLPAVPLPAVPLPAVPLPAAAPAAFDDQARAATEARRAIDMVTARGVGAWTGTGAAAQLAAIPPDFAATMGYTPVLGRLADGRPIVVNPHGGCSVVGGGAPFDLATPCKAHDLGYDLLRYSHRHGVDLPAQARREVDDTFGADLKSECAARYRGVDARSCDVIARSFDLGVGFNSWRQEFEAPVARSGMVRTVGVGLLALTTLAAGAIAATRRVRQRRTLLAPLAADLAA